MNSTAENKNFRRAENKNLYIPENKILKTAVGVIKPYACWWLIWPIQIRCKKPETLAHGYSSESTQ